MKTATAEKQASPGESIAALMEKSALAVQQNDLAGAARTCVQILAVDPNNVAVLNRLGVVEAKRGNLGGAIIHLKTALAVDPGNVEVKGNLAQLQMLQGSQKAEADPLLDALRAYTELAEQVRGNPTLAGGLITQSIQLGAKLAQANRRECIDALRLALRFRPQPLLGHVDLHNYLWRFGERARLDDFTREITPDQLGKTLLVACFPKSGSTLLKRLLCEATGFGEAQFVSGFLQNEQETYLPAVLHGARANRVVQQHCRATGPNVHLLQAFGIRPVVLVRNIFDVLLSWKEFLDGGATLNTFFPNYHRLSDEQRLALVVDDRAPWYLGFFAGWQHVVTTGLIDGHWMTYESLTADPRAAIESILAFYGITPDPARLARAAGLVNRDRGSTRFNKGVVGRGLAAFSEAQVAQIRRLAGLYPGADFSLIGL